MSTPIVDASSETPIRRVRLAGLLLVAGLLAFITALIAFTERPSPTWLLYLAPVIVGALAYEVPGGVASALVGALACVVVAPSEALSGSWPEFALGFGVFAACGVVVGVQTRRQRGHASALEAASVTDPLTGVAKREHFESRLAEEVRRAERYENALGVIVVRVSDYEGFVRVFGAYKADLMLAHLASVIRLAVRSSDFVGRIAEATFAVALPHADPREAREVAMRVHAACEEATFEGDALEPTTRCASEVGWAAYPADARTPAELLEAATRRLSADHRSTDSAERADEERP